MADLTGGRDLASSQSFARHEPEGRRGRADGARQGMDYTPPPRTAAFKAAGRHTARVKFLRRTMVVGAVFAVSMIAIFALFDPFKRLPGSLSIAGVGVQGTKITMDSPKITGVQQGGGKYEIKATQGIQDITHPTVIDLVGVDAKVGMADRTTTRILAKTGTYDNKADTMALSGEVKIANTSGYVLNMKSALMSFRAGVFSSKERLRVDLKGGDVAADEMTIANNGHAITFQGHIASTFQTPDEPETPVPAASAEASPSQTAETPQ